MNEQRIQELKTALAEVVQLIQRDPSSQTPEVEALLARVMEHVANRIRQLRQEDAAQQPTGGGPPVQPPIPGEGSGETPFPSSNVSKFKYDPENQKLYVQFLDKWPNRNGPRYVYDNVQPFVAELLARGAVGPRTSGKNRWHQWFRNRSPSHGAVIANVLKAGNFPYRRLT